jgi:hypothetical protein
MGKSDLVQKVGGTNTLLVPGSQKLGGPVPPVPKVVAPMFAWAAIPWGSRGPDPPLSGSVGVHMHVDPHFLDSS